MEKYIPKVGEECLVFNNELSNAEFEKCTPVFIGVHIIVYNSESCLERVSALTFCEFKPLPTEKEEKIIDEMFKGIESVSETSYHLGAKTQMDMCKALIKAGYRKVEPLSFCKFTECNNNDKGDIYNWLTRHNHIIAK